MFEVDWLLSNECEKVVGRAGFLRVIGAAKGRDNVLLLDDLSGSCQEPHIPQRLLQSGGVA